LEKNRYGAINEVTLRKVEAGLRAHNVEMMSEMQSVGAGVRWIVDPANVGD
jgi:glycine cleavage system aminomethyltransferase T